MNKPREIILHCAATPEGRRFNAADIDRMHKQRGFKKIGYHYVIGIDGKVEPGRGENENGAHCVGHNTKSIGICYIGGVAKDGKTAKDTRTREQKVSMYKLVDDMMGKYGLELKDVHGHYEFANKACPSFKMEQFRKEFTEWKAGKSVMLTAISNGGLLEKLFSFILGIMKLFKKK